MTGKRLVINTMINIANTAISFVVAFIMTPIILQRLGTEQYGVWVFLGIFTVSGYFSLLDLGFQGSAIKFISEFRAKNDTENLRHVINATTAFFVAAGLTAGAILLVVNNFFLGNIFHLNPGDLLTAKVLLNFIALGLLFEFPAMAFSAILEGLQRYDLLRGISTLVTIASNIIVFFFLKNNHGLSFMVTVTIAGSVLLSLFYFSFSNRLLPGFRINPFKTNRRSFSLLYHMSWKLFVSKIVGLIFNNTDKILIGIFLSVTVLTEYDIVNRVHILVLMIPSMLQQAVIPTTAHLEAQGDRDGLRTLLIRGTKYSAALVLPIVVFLLVYMPQFLKVWVGGNYAYLAPLARLYVTHVFLTGLVGFGATMLVGVNKVEKGLKISVAAALINLAISLITVQWFGIYGLISGTVVAYLISSLLYVQVLKHLFNFSVTSFVRDVVVKIYPLALVFAGLLVVLKPYVRLPNIGTFALFALTCGILYVTVFMLSGLDRTERDLLNGWTQRIFKRVYQKP